jgi:outer membrane receptor protein involved in Fe transport
MNAIRHTLCALVFALACGGLYAQEPMPEIPAKAVDISSPTLLKALIALQQQTGLQFICPTDGTGETPVGRVAGTYTPRAVIERLLKGTGVKYEFINERTVAISSKLSPVRPAQTSDASKESLSGHSQDISLSQQNGGGESDASQANQSPPSKASLEEIGVNMPEVLVKGSRLLNMDIPRTQDDVQPYVILGREAIARSSANSLEEFLQQRLAMAATGRNSDKFPSSSGVNTQINLRGLGANQTLVLIDGHRTASSALTAGAAVSSQPDLNTIPLAAIERIEVLPATASGIYGGGATGGVVNIVMRRDFSGSEIRAAFDNSFEGGGASRRVDLSTGFGSQSGNTRVFLAGSYSDSDPLTAGERSFIERGRLKAYRNNPDKYLGLFIPPPLSATANIASAFDFFTFSQPDLMLKDGTPLNSTITSAPADFENNGSVSGLVDNAGRYNLRLADVADVNGGRRGAILGNPTRKSITGTLRQELTPRLQAFLELSASQDISRFQSGSSSGTFFLSSALPNNPFQQDILVTVPFTENPVTNIETRATDQRVMGGLILNLPRSWTAEADYTWSRWYRSPSADSGFVDPFGFGGVVAAGTPDILRDPERFPLSTAGFFNPPSEYSSVTTMLKDLSLRFAGPAFQLWTGPVNVLVLFEHRKEFLGEQRTVSPSPFGTSINFSPDKDQSVDSVYLETHVPLISKHSERAWVRELELMVAARQDRYRVNGANPVLHLVDGDPLPTIERVRNETRSTNPTVGLRFVPLADLTFRGSYGTGFLPPSVIQLVPEADSVVPPNVFAGLIDPQRGNSPVIGPMLLHLGGNSNLKPEKSESWSFGTIITPQFIPHARVSIDYTQIEKTDNIASLSSQQVIDNESALGSRVIRGPNLPGDLPGWAGPIIELDPTLANIARAKVEAYDLQVDYEMSSRSWGSFDFYMLGTWQTHLQTQLTPSSEVFENVGIFSSFNVTKFKGSAGATLARGDWRFGWAARYLGSYLVADPAQASSAPLILSQGNGGRVPSQMYHDVLLAWSSPATLGDSIFSGLEIKLGIANVFNKVPPFDASNDTYFYSFYGDPRLRSYSVSIRKSFTTR